MGGEGAVEFLEFGLDDLRDYRDVDVIVCRVVGDTPGRVEDVAKAFGLETVDALDVGWFG